MKEGVIETASSGGKIYGVPFNMHVNGIYCNTELFESNNISYPTTWEELIDVCRQFSELGITPTVSYTHLDVYKRQFNTWATAVVILSKRSLGGTPPMRSKIRFIPSSRHSWF